MKIKASEEDIKRKQRKQRKKEIREGISERPTAQEMYNLATRNSDEIKLVFEAIKKAARAGDLLVELKDELKDTTIQMLISEPYLFTVTPIDDPIFNTTYYIGFNKSKDEK